MNTSRVSVVITSYNQKDYLIEAVESALRQSRPVHEIIVADDGSTDGSVEVIRGFQNDSPERITGVLNPRNQGIPGNRNSGLDSVTGDYVCILDGDDRFLPDNCERMLAALEEAPDCRCVYGNVNFIDADGAFLRVRDREPQPSGDIFFEVALGMFGILRNMLIDVALLRETGSLDTRFPRYDGFDLTVRLAKRCRIAYLLEPTAEYRVYPTSDSKGLKARDHLNDLEGIARKMRPLLRDLPIEKRRKLRRVWSQRLLRYYREDWEHNPRSIRRIRLLGRLLRGFVTARDAAQHF